MEANFFIEPQRLRPACIKAIETIKKNRLEKKREALKSLCDKFNKKNEHWLVRLIRRRVTAEKYDLQKMIDDVEYRKQAFAKEYFDWELEDFRAACVYATHTEELCEKLLAACSASRGDINISVEDWYVVSSWSE